MNDQEQERADEIKQEVEQEAREVGAPTAPPVSEPEPEPEPTIVNVQVKCGNPNCGSQFEFPIDPSVNGFRFQCTECGAANQWSRN